MGADLSRLHVPHYVAGQCNLVGLAPPQPLPKAGKARSRVSVASCMCLGTLCVGHKRWPTRMPHQRLWDCGGLAWGRGHCDRVSLTAGFFAVLLQVCATAPRGVRVDGASALGCSTDRSPCVS